MPIVDSRIIALLADNVKLKNSLKASEQKNERLENIVNNLKAKNKKLSKENAHILKKNKDLKWKMGVSMVEKCKLTVKLDNIEMKNESCAKENRKLNKNVRKEKIKWKENH